MKVPEFLPIDDHKNLVRDTKTMAVINTDSKGLMKAKLQKQLALQRIAQEAARKVELNNIKDEVSGLKSDIASIKDMMGALLAKLDKE